jgi:hypothetical protein
MSNFTHEDDIKLMELQSNFIESFQDLAETMNKYNELFVQLSIIPKNSEILKKFHTGMNSLSQATENLADAFKALCIAHDVDMT